MEQRNFKFSLTIDSANYLISTATINFNLMEGYASINATLNKTEEISTITDMFIARTLTDKTCVFNFELVGVKKVLNIQDLTMYRFAPTEQIDGYIATATLIPKAAAICSITPSVFTSTNYKFTVKSMIEAIRSAYNAEFPTHPLKSLYYDALDTICCVTPRFLNMSYMDMFRQIVNFHGLNVLIDFDSTIRVFSIIKAKTPAIMLNKHQVIESGVTNDTAQYFVS